MRTRVIFSEELVADGRHEVVSTDSIAIIKAAAERSKNPEIIITSTIRPPHKQAQAMFYNLQAGKRIRYAAPGREVVDVYDNLEKMHEEAAYVIHAMEMKIIDLSNRGQRVSRHCVTETEYRHCNIIDVSTRIPNPRDFVRELLKENGVKKIITPVTSTYNDPRVMIDHMEPAIHIEIEQL